MHYDGSVFIFSFLDIKQIPLLFIVMVVTLFIRHFSELGTISSTFQIFVISLTVLQGRFHYTHFTNEKTETPRSKVTDFKFMHILLGRTETL